MVEEAGRTGTGFAFGDVNRLRKSPMEDDFGFA
jgi:hypothetical protein